MKKILYLILILLWSGFADASMLGTLTMLDSVTIAQSQSGARWTYSSSEGGTNYSLYGRLWVPKTIGVYPAAIVNHGYLGGADLEYDVAAPMRDWGMIVIAVNLTHCSGTRDSQCPGGSCSPSGPAGASTQNYQRIYKVWEILQNIPLSYGTVDVDRIAIHGHSAGAYATMGAADAYAGRFRVASHTGGGYCTSSCPAYTPTADEIDAIATPYSINHGQADTTVPLIWDSNFQSALNSRQVPNEFNTYAGLDHAGSKKAPAVLTMLKAWYTKWGIFASNSSTSTSSSSSSSTTSIKITTSSSSSTTTTVRKWWQWWRR